APLATVAHRQRGDKRLDRKFGVRKPGEADSTNRSREWRRRHALIPRSAGFRFLCKAFKRYDSAAQCFLSFRAEVGPTKRIVRYRMKTSRIVVGTLGGGFVSALCFASLSWIVIFNSDPGF